MKGENSSVDASANSDSVQRKSRFEAAFVRFLCRPHLPLEVALMAVFLALPCLFLGFYLDDWVGRYIYSDLEGAKELYRMYAGGYGVATGIPADNHWQVEHGDAPWWIYPNLLLQAYRPLSLVTHLLDARLWPNSAVLWHAHNLVWLGIFIFAAALTYRRILGVTVGGLAALLLAFDHTHGFSVGFIVNRHAVITGSAAMLCFHEHVRSRDSDAKLSRLTAPVLYAATLLCGEFGVALAAYLLGYAWFVDRGRPRGRIWSVAPYLVITLIWRAAYNRMGFGAIGSGVYLDPGREPVRFFLAFLERGPLLVLGQFLAPPAEAYSLFSPGLARAVLAFAVLFIVGLVAALVPLLRRSRTARMWSLGVAASLIPAASALPHNRQLLFASIGAMALIAELWDLHTRVLAGRALSAGLKLSALVGGIVLSFHLLLSPLISPFSTCSIGLTAPFHRTLDRVGPELAGKEAVFVTVPDYWLLRLVQLKKRVEGQPLPRHFRALSFGTQPITLSRVDERTLLVDYEGGILSTPLMELYRDRRLRMSPGDRVELEGLSIRVVQVTSDGRPTRAEFVFDHSLSGPDFVYYCWAATSFELCSVPGVGESRRLPGATIRLGLN